MKETDCGVLADKSYLPWVLKDESEQSISMDWIKGLVQNSKKVNEHDFIQGHMAQWIKVNLHMCST